MKKNGSLRRNSHSTSTEDGAGTDGRVSAAERCVPFRLIVQKGSRRNAGCSGSTNVCNVCKKVQSLDSVLLWGYNT